MRTRASNSFNLKPPLCKTTTYQASFFNRIVKLWNAVCSAVYTPNGFSSSASFTSNVKKLMFKKLETLYDPDWTCTWTLVPTCPCHSGHN